MDVYEIELASLQRKEERADSTTLGIIAVLLLIGGLAALVHTLNEASRGNPVFDVSILGLAAFPGLLFRRTLPYWIALAVASVQIIWSMVGLVLVALLTTNTIGGSATADLIRQASNTQQILPLIWSLLVSWWIFRVLREPRIRKRFGI